MTSMRPGQFKLLAAACGLLGIAAVTVVFCLTGDVDAEPPGGDSPVREAAAETPKDGARAGEAGWVFDGDMPPMKATTPEEVREVYLFARDADSDDIPALRTMALKSEDPLVAGNAIKALGRMNALSGDKEFFALLDDKRPRIRQEMVTALGLSGDSAAAEKLLPLLESSGPDLRPLVIQALGRICGKPAKERLEIIARNENESPTDRVFARTALDVLGSAKRRITAVKPVERPRPDGVTR